MPLTKITGGEFDSTSSGGLVVSGIVTATSFSGSGANLTGLTGASANTYGNPTVVPQIVIDGNGRITSISNVAISAGGGGGGGGTGINVRNLGSLVGFAGTIDFGTGLTASAVSSQGISTITVGFLTYSAVSGFATVSTQSGIATSVVGGVANVTSLNVTNTTGISTFVGLATHTAPLFGTQASFTGVVTATSVSDSSGNLRSVPQNSQTSAYILIASDAGKHISITTGGVTVNASIFSAGDAVTIYNNSASNQTITQGTSVTLRQGGTANTGNRTLAQYGVCTVLCIVGGGTPTFVISGAGLS